MACAFCAQGTLGQIITNLTQNAVIHAFAGRASGRMQISAYLQDAQHVMLEFRDDGGGIDPAHLSRVFDPFFTTRRNDGGPGLGLHIVYNLVTQKLGGRIEVKSALGEGTTFSLLLPLQAPR